MGTMELNGQVKTITDTFFSKENISSLNKKILEKNKLTEIPKEAKKKIIDLLIKNMKIIYKSLDLKKINKKNFDSIYQQFNKTSFNETQKELSLTDILGINEVNAAQLKFERDFNSNPNNGNKVSERPVPSQNINQFLYPPNNNQNKSNNDKFDKLFKPIVEQVNENYKFNEYQYGKGSQDINKRIEELTSEREGETRLNGRPRTPDFLKPTKTQPEKNDHISIQIPDLKKKGGKPDFTQNFSQDELDIGFLSNNSDNVDLYNINNIDKPIDIREIEEDNRSFQERLKSLEHERTNVNIPPNKGKIDFTSETFNNTEINEIPDYEPKTVEQIREEKYLSEMKKRQEISEQSKEQLIEQMRREQLREHMKKEQLREQMIKEQLTESMRIEQLKEHMRKEQLKEHLRKEQVQIQEQMKREQNIQKQEVYLQSSKTILNKNLDISKIQNTLKKLGMVEAYEVEKIKKENEILKNELSHFNNNKMDLVKQDIILEFEKLNNKETLVTKKIEEMKLLMVKYQYLYGTSNIQLDISPDEPLSNFSFEFGPIENIIGIKLMSYSIPQARYNIESGKNNIFQIKNMNNEIIELKLNSGKYSIESLLEKLNTKSEKYKFELNVEQFVEISSDESFEIIPTPLSKEVLGFTSICKENSKFIADKLWDLRIEEKIFLFINNLDDSTPFAVLYTINQGNYSFKFEELIKLDKLELSFRDSNGRPFNFYGLKYNLNIQLEINNPVEEINI